MFRAPGHHTKVPGTQITAQLLPPQSYFISYSSNLVCLTLLHRLWAVKELSGEEEVSGTEEGRGRCQKGKNRKMGRAEDRQTLNFIYSEHLQHSPLRSSPVHTTSSPTHPPVLPELNGWEFRCWCRSAEVKQGIWNNLLPPPGSHCWAHAVTGS